MAESLSQIGRDKVRQVMFAFELISHQKLWPLQGHSHQKVSTTSEGEQILKGPKESAVGSIEVIGFYFAIGAIAITTLMKQHYSHPVLLQMRLPLTETQFRDH